MIMKISLKHSLATAAVVLTIALYAFVVSGCSSKNTLDPSEVVETFTRAVAGGDIDEAYRLCDSLAMKDYIEGYRRAMYTKAATDSAAVSIASGILSDIKIIVLETVRSKDYRMVEYTIEDTYGHTKDKTATLKEEEGEWKVTEIKDRN